MMDEAIFIDIENKEISDTNVAVHAGFPNAAADRSVRDLDLNQLLVKNPSSTYLFRIHGHQWEEQGIFDSDLAIVDRSLAPRKTDLVLWWRGSEFVVSKFSKHNEATEVWGVVTALIHSYL